MVAEEAIATAFRRRMCVLADNDEMHRVLLRLFQLRRRQQLVTVQRHHVDTEPAIQPLPPPREPRQHSILAPDHVAIAGAR